MALAGHDIVRMMGVQGDLQVWGGRVVSREAGETNDGLGSGKIHSLRSPTCKFLLIRGQHVQGNSYGPSPQVGEVAYAHGAMYWQEEGCSEINNGYFKFSEN